MSHPDHVRELALKIINKEKWWDILSRFIDVLRINIFIVDNQGSILLPPEEGKYGGRLLTDRTLGLDLISEPPSFFQKFQRHGLYLEYASRLKLHQFAIPININGDTIGYMIVGPVILSKRLENAEYERIAREKGISDHDLISEINALRVVSNVMMNSILDLLYEIVKNNVALSGIKKEIYKPQQEQSSDLSREVKEAAKNLYSTVCLDELLVTLLDVALKMTRTECGSIMVADEEKEGDMMIRVSRGVNLDKMQNVRVKIGEGICGTAARERVPYYLIHGQEGSNRIKHLLKRPEIKHSLVMPLVSKKGVFGVLNLHTKEDDCAIENNIENLQYLSRLLASVM